jgi:hypothetical protein
LQSVDLCPMIQMMGQFSIQYIDITLATVHRVRLQYTAFLKLRQLCSSRVRGQDSYWAGSASWS